MKKTKKKNKDYVLEDYDTLLRVKNKLKKRVRQEEDFFRQGVGVFQTVYSLFSANKSKNTGRKSGGSYEQPATSNLISTIGRSAFSYFFSDKDKNKKIKITTNLITIAGAVGLAIWANRKINRFIDKHNNKTE